MKKRPLCMACLLLIGWIFILFRTGKMTLPSCPEFMRKQSIQIQGQVYRQEKKNQNYLLYLKKVSIISIGLSKKNYSYDFNVVVYAVKGDMTCKIGNKVVVTGICTIPEAASNPGQFDMQTYYQQQKIGFLLQKAECKVVDQHYSRYRHGLSELRLKMKESLYTIAEEEDAAVLCAMLLGDNTELDNEVKDAYRYAGISHILAISGLHISFFGMFIFRIFRKLGISYGISGFVSGFLLLSYGILTGMSPSASRAILMFCLYLGAQITGRTYDLPSGLAFAAILILIQNPLYLFHAGFLLSFVSILGIAFFYPKLKEIYPSKNKVIDSLLLSISIQCMILPCILYFYYEFSLYGILLNLAVIPGSSFLLLSGILGGMVGLIFVKGGVLIISAAHYILTGYRILCDQSIKLPGALQLWGAPTLSRILCYYVVLGCLLASLKLTEKKSLWFRRVQTIVGVTVLLLFMAVRFHTNLEITFLDVGQGDSIYWRSPSGTTYLCDGGSSTISRVGKYRLEPFLKYHGIGEIDYLFLTHMDADHINGVEELLEQGEGGIRIQCLILPDLDKNDEAYQRIETAARKKQIKIIYFQAGMKMEDGELSLTCLYPNPKTEGSDKNENSLVLQLNYREFSVLLTGDLEGKGEEMLLRGGMLERMEILKVAHHGSKGATGVEFLGKIVPKVAILSYGKENSYGHPHKELIDRLKEMGCHIFSTAEDGAVTLKSNGKSYTLKSYKN